MFHLCRSSRLVCVVGLSPIVAASLCHQTFAPPHRMEINDVIVSHREVLWMATRGRQAPLSFSCESSKCHF